MTRSGTCSSRRCLLALLLCATSSTAFCADDPFVDPKPPTRAELAPIPDPKPEKNSDATFVAVPRPPPEGAQLTDWPCFLGPNHNLIVPETRLLKDLPASGPRAVWEMK